MTSFRHCEPVMGTMVNFEVVASGHPRGASPAGALRRAVAWLHWVDATFSTYQPGSEVSRLDRGELTAAQCCPELRTILSLCDELRSGTDGYFDAMASGHLDPSGVVKGWSIERASALLAQEGWPDHMVEGGGDIRTHGSPGSGRQWQVGLAHPFRRDALCAVIEVGEAAVATSGTYERGLHVIDPHRGRPAAELSAVTVVGPELVRTDAYATAALARGEGAWGWLEALEGYEALVIDAVGRGRETSGFARYRVGPGGPPGAAVDSGGSGAYDPEARKALS